MKNLQEFTESFLFMGNDIKAFVIEIMQAC